MAAGLRKDWAVIGLCFLALSGVRSVSGLKVLLVPTMPLSHVLELSSLGEGLLNLGHQVSIVVMDSFPLIGQLRERGLHVLTFPGPSEEEHLLLFSGKTGEKLEDVIFVGRDKYATFGAEDCTHLVLRDCEYMLNHQPLIDTVRNMDFDIAVADGFALGYCVMLLPYSLGIPFTVAYSGAINPWAFRIPSLPSFSPMQITWYSQDMTLYERAWNILMTYMMEAAPIFPQLNNVTLAHRYDKSLTSWSELKRKALLYFIFKDFHLDYPDASMPNVIRVPGITIREGNPLDDDMSALYRQNKQIVLVTFGSTANTFPLEIVHQMFTAFSKFDGNFTFVMRLSAKKLKMYKEVHSMPGNVHIRDWVQQQDLLAHHQTALFITHGGNMGQWESLYHGVPMVCLPLFAEQPYNCRRMAEKGFGLTLDLYELQPGELEAAITEVTRNASYRAAVRLGATMLRARKESPAETVSGWLEHVDRFGGKHLRSHAMDLPLHKFLMLDLIAIAILVVVVLVVTLELILFLCIRRLGIGTSGLLRITAATVLILFMQHSYYFVRQQINQTPS